MTIAERREQIWQSLRDLEYRHQFVEEEINVGIAFQIRSIRNRQKLTQEKLAEKLQGKQSLVSAWEDPNYGKYSLATLKGLAKAFDVGLLVRFVPFSTLIDWTVNLTSNIIAPPNYSEEENCHTLASTTSTPVEDKGRAIEITNISAVSDYINNLQQLDTFPNTAMTLPEGKHA